MEYSIKTSYFIGLCAFALSLSTYFVYGAVTKESFLYSFAILFATQVTYSALRLDDLVKHEKHSKQFIKMAILPVIATLSLLYFAGLTYVQYLFLGLSAILTFIYSSHIWKRAQPYSFRNNAFLKLICIGIVWMILTTLIPLLDIVETFHLRNYLHNVVIFFFIIFLTIPFELNDNSPFKGNKTLPHILGEEMTIKVGRMLAITTWFCSGFVSVPLFLAMSICVVLYLKFINQNLRNLTLKMLTLRFDGIIILFSALVMLLTFGVK